MKEAFSKIPSTTFQHIGINAGMLLKDFNWQAGTYENEDILGATTGGINFTATPEFTDFGEDIDNCPKNTKQLKRVSDISVTCSGTFVAIDSRVATYLAAVADKQDLTLVSTRHHKIIPRSTVDITNDFHSIWIVGDYSDTNTGATAGFIAIRMDNVMNTGGFQIQTADKEKMQFSFEFTAHYSIDNQDKVPYEIYVVDGGNTTYLSLDSHELWVAVGDSVPLTATYVGSYSTATLDWAVAQYPISTGDVATLDHSSSAAGATTDSVVITGASKGYAIVSVSRDSLIETCIVHVTAS